MRSYLPQNSQPVGRLSNLKQPSAVKPKQPAIQSNNQELKSSIGRTSQVFQISGQMNPQSKSSAGNQRPLTTQISQPITQPSSQVSHYQPISLFIHKIIGSTSNTADNLILVNQNICIYLAQSFIVFYDFRSNKQLLHYQNPNNKPYRALLFDEVQQTLFAGEGNTKQGEIQVFKVQIDKDQGVRIEQQIILKGHKYGIAQMKLFESLLVSVGDENDKGMIVWDIRNPRMISANLMKNAQIQGVQFLKNNENQIEFISFGTKNHLKIWSINIDRDDYMTTYSINGISEIKQGQTIPKLIGKKIIIKGIPEDIEWQQLLIDNDKIAYVIGFTRSKEQKSYLIASYNLEQNALLQQISLPHSSNEIHIIDIHQEYLLLTNSMQRLQQLHKQTFKFSTQNFQWASPPEKGQLQMITQEIYDYLVSTANTSTSQFSQITGILVKDDILVQILNDGMILFHDFKDNKLIRVMTQHFDSINDLAIKEYHSGEEQLSFFSCSKDNTLRIWNTYLGDPEIAGMIQDPTKPVEGDLKRTVYLDSQDEIEGSFMNREIPLEDEIGIKCLAYNQMRNQLAIGDMVGNIRIYQMSQDNHQYLHQVNFIEAHEGKVVALQYSEPFNMNNSDQYVQFLVSASSDRMIHIFNAKNDDYELIQTIEAHTTSIVDAKFTKCTIAMKNKHKVTQYEKQLRLYTCSTDKSLQSHKYNPSDGRFMCIQPKDLHRNKIYKLALTEEHLILAKDQGIIEVKSLESGKQVQQFQQTPTQNTFNKTMLDYTYATVSHDQLLIALNDKEKSIQIREVRGCNSLLTKFGLADIMSSIQFTDDNSFLIGSSQTSKELGGGLIYIFRVEHDPALIKRDNVVIQQQRNQDKVLIIDQSLGSSKQQQQFDQLLQMLPQQRKFTVKEDLFNTWAKSTNQQNNNEQVIQPQKQQSALQSFKEDEDFIEKQSAYQSLRRSTFQSPPKKFKGLQGQPPDQEPIQKQSLDDFVEEVKEVIKPDRKYSEQHESNIQLPKIESDGSSLKFQEIDDNELQKSIHQNQTIESANGSRRNTMTMRNSITLRYLIETPRGNQGLTVNKSQLQFTDMVQPMSIVESANQNEQSPENLRSSTFRTKPKKTLFTKLVSKIEKIEDIIMEQEDIDPLDLKQQERIELSVKINKTMQKLQQLQLKFLSVND